jgi:hypothetical protein
MAPANDLHELMATVDDRAPGDDPLAKLAAAVGVAQELDAVADALVGHYVETARLSGASWSRIGEAMGVTKQGAQQRFGGPTSLHADVLPHMERMTPRGRRVLAAAAEEAREAGHGYVGTEHLLLGLLHEPEAIAAKVLEQQGATAERIRAETVTRLGPRSATTSDDPPLTPRARRVLDLALGEALRLGHNYLGTEHLLLALLTEGTGIGAQVLAAVDVDHEATAARIVEMLSGFTR